MKDKKKDNKSQITIDYEKKNLSFIYFLPLLFLICFVPLIVYGKLIDLSESTQKFYWLGQNQYLDFFSYWKSVWIVFFTSLTLVIYIILYKQNKLPLKNMRMYYIPLFVYAIFVILSSVFANDKSTALWGFVDMYQGMFVLLSYIILTFVTINFVNSNKDINLFLNAFIILVIVEGILGISQYFGFDFLQTKIGKSIIVPSYLKINNLSFTFGAKTIYATLFNTNFVGSFATLMLPLTIAYVMLAKTKKKRIIGIISFILAVFVWVGCNSRAGYFGVLISLLFAIYVFRKFIIKHLKASVMIVLVMIVLVILINSISGGMVVNRLKVFSEVFNSSRVQDEDKVKFEDIILGKDTFSIITNKETLNFKLEGDRLYFLDGDNNELEIDYQETITIKDERYKNYYITIPDEYPGVSIVAYNKRINFYLMEDGIKVIGTGGRVVEVVDSPMFGPLKGYETLASNRGYEWGTTIPMLKNYILKGAGPDNFPMVYNQDDFVGKLNLIDFDANIVIDKPHNMYLQIGVNTGVLSLITMVIMWGIYIISSLRIYKNCTFDKIEELVGGFCLISIIGYLSAAIFNDSVNSVAPLFWIILGLGISINAKVKNQRII